MACRGKPWGIYFCIFPLFRFIAVNLLSGIKNYRTMVELILHNDIDNGQMEALVHFLKLCNIDAEVKKESIATIKEKKKKKISLTAGIWSDYEIDAHRLRQNAWKHK